MRGHKPLSLPPSEDQVLKQDPQRGHYAGGKPVAGFSVTPDEDGKGGNERGEQQDLRHRLRQDARGVIRRGAHRSLPPLRSVITPSRTSATTVISPRVSSPRKSASITVTMSLA